MKITKIANLFKNIRHTKIAQKRKYCLKTCQYLDTNYIKSTLFAQNIKRM